MRSLMFVSTRAGFGLHRVEPTRPDTVRPRAGQGHRQGGMGVLAPECSMSPQQLTIL